jgi:hypothetical protein
MTRRRTLFGLCVMTALWIGGVPLQAAAESPTAATCVSTAKVKEFSSAHCVPGETGTAFGQVEINEETHAKLSNANTNATTTGPTNVILKEAIASTNLELESTGVVEGLGTLKNSEVGGEMRATATSDASGITFNGVTVKAPAEKGCKVYEDKSSGEEGAEGVIKTKPVTGHTIVTGTTHEVVIEPVTPTVFATFFITCTPGKVPAELEGTWTITGSIKCPTHGATIACEHGAITTQNTLKGKGSKVGLAGKVTITAGKFPTTEPTNPISFTTGPVGPPEVPEQTAFLCTEAASTKDFSSAHCVPGESGTKFGHVPITEEPPISLSNASTNATTTGPTSAVLKQTIAAVNVEVKATGAIEGLGTLRNEVVAGAMRASANSDSNGVTFNGVEVAAPAGEGCKVFEDKGGVKGTEGVIRTKPLTGYTVATETKDEVHIQPSTSTLFATFFVECTPGNVPAELEGTWEVTGSINCPIHGATIACEHAAITTQNTLKAKGFKAGIEGKATVKAAKPTTPISLTTAQGGASGQEAFTCSSGAGEKQFISAHCVPGETGAAFGHVPIAEETQAKFSNEKTNATTTGPTNSILKETIAATNLELESTGVVEGLGTLKNEEVGGEMRATSTSDANGITFNGVIVKAPKEKGCIVYEDKLNAEGKPVEGTEGVIKTKPVTGHTIVTGTTHEAIIEPVTPNVFATFWITCTPHKVPAELEGTWTITGSIKCPTQGATINCEHGLITTQNTLKGKGAKAGLQGKATITAGKVAQSEPTDPVSVTTTTP